MKKKRIKRLSPQQKFYNRLKYLGFKSYKEYLKSPHWLDVRNRYWKSKLPKRCYICGEYSNLQLHHKTYKRLGKEHLQDLIFLCKFCHKHFHKIFKKKRKKGGKINLWNATRKLKRRILNLKNSKIKQRNLQIS